MRCSNILRKLFQSTALFSLLISFGCTGSKGSISASNAGSTNAVLSTFKVLNFQGNPSTSWLTQSSTIWKTNLHTLTITGSCARGISNIMVSQRLSGSGAALADSGVTASCTNNVFSWVKDYSTDPNYSITTAGNSVQYDFNIYALDGLGNQVTDPAALTAVRMYRLAPTVLTSITYYKAYIQQSVPIVGPNISLTDSPDSDIGGSGHCPSNTSQFTLTGTQDPQATISLAGATSTNSSSATVLSYMVCVPFGNTSLSLSTKDEANNIEGTQYTINLITSSVAQTLGSADEGFKFQALSPQLASLTSQGVQLVNISSDQMGKASTASTGAAGYSMATGLSSYVKQVSP